MTSSVVFYYANELHETSTMVRFGPFPFTPLRRRTDRSSLFLMTPTGWNDPICAWEKQAITGGKLRNSQKKRENWKWSSTTKDSSGQKSTTKTAWQISEPSFTQHLSTLKCHILNSRKSHGESRIVHNRSKTTILLTKNQNKTTGSSFGPSQVRYTVSSLR